MLQLWQKGQCSTDCTVPKNNENENSNMVSKVDFKNIFQSSLKDMLTKKEKQTKKKDNMDIDHESLDMNVFENSSIESTNNLFHFGQNTNIV
jgi:hypothetical protein